MMRNRGKKNASKEMNHHLSGCNNALQQERINKRPTPIFRKIKNRLVNFRSDVMKKDL
jgi:hypothetical protein